LVLSNSDAFYEWEKVKSSVTGTLTVETFEPRIKLTIRNCHYEANQWKTNTEVSKTSSAVFTRICPTTNLVIKAWCVSTNILHLQNGKAVAIEKLYDCSPAP
jgi:thiamine pyrophosphokinase